MANKEVSFSLDIEELERQLDLRRETEPEEEKAFSVRSTVFALGKDPRVSTKPPVSPPDFYQIEILKDGLDNPYLQLHWRVDRESIDSGRIIGFNIFRRRLSAEESISFRGTRVFDAAAVERLARKNKKVGKFFTDRKPIFNIKRGSIPLNILNPNLSEIKQFESARLFQTTTNEDSPAYTGSEFERFFSSRKFEKIAYVDYTKFAQEEKNKFLVVKDRNFVDLSYKDKKVGYSETFEYYIDAVTKDLEDVPNSSTISVTVENVDFVNVPKSVIVKQVNEREVQLSICVHPQDNVSKAIIFRKSNEEVLYQKLTEVENTNDCMNVLDFAIEYGKTYTYRVFLENIHGNLSQPKEIKFFSSVQRITPESRSNVLKIPIVSAAQDQNSDFIKITISPNDPKIAFYELRRRDLSINERRFSSPSKEETRYGGNGWTANKFFIQKTKIPVSDIGESSDLKTKTVLPEIVFVDDTVSIGHIYQYRVRGYDLFGNASSYAFSTVRATGKKSIRAPINLKSEVLRNYPFRVKISWDDDNIATLLTSEELFAGQSNTETKPNKVLYRIQRRKINETVYESFPLTANNFIIDEVASSDVVAFDGTKIADTFTRMSNMSGSDSAITIQNNIRRSFKLPNFLKENDIYFYRIAAISNTGEESNTTEEFQVFSVPDLSDPVNFGAEVANTKVAPISVRLFWQVEPTKSIPDSWTIERRFDSANDSFTFLGRSHLLSEFIDRHVEPGNTYIYRIKAYDAIGRESAFFETRISL